MADKGEITLYIQMQGVLAGNSTEECLCALCDSLAAVIAFAAHDLAHADEIADTLPVDIKTTMRDNWEHVRNLRANAATLPVTKSRN
jgi:hypothetical protein